MTMVLAACCTCSIQAQRMTDRLGRGLVAVPTGSSGNSTTNMVTWRRLAEEYFGVTYNLYKNGSLLASGLTVPCYADNNSGLSSSQYEVAAVVNGVEQTKCAAVTPWKQYVYNLVERCATGYLDLPLATITDGSGNDITSHYIPNDAEFADLDGDGELEMIIKRLNTVDSDSNFAYDITEHDRIDAYDINWQTGETKLLWWIEVGPNMVSGGSHELNIIAYDWDEDGKAEVVLRGADDMMVWWARGGSRTPYPRRIGTKGVNTRNSVTHTANMTYTNTGAEYLIYMNGDTGEPYHVIDYPLARESAGAWGDNYGHRSSKYFFGAPVFDGRKASLFLARGIYTRHKMAAYDINSSTHELTLRWQWSNNGGWDDPWYGNGNHNYSIADVDEDGRDEIIYGSMVIDDNGKGLSTTGLGHGDALHCGDFDPFRPGLEIFACNEDEPCMNYRNATTSQLYVRRTSSDDDGRALCANFSNTYPGAMGRSTQTGMISCVADADISELGGDSFIAWSDLNFRIYWDGDLLSEILNSPGTERDAKIDKPGKGRLFTSSDCNMNNYTKNHPCFSGDLIGDWREELVLRCGQNVRVYTSGYYTSHNIYTLWHDHEYRQAMVWQMHAYNQPPHPSFFLGELEDITVAPPPLSLTDREVVNAGGTIGSTGNGKDVLTYGYGNNTYNLTASVSPKALIMNVPVWTQGNNNNSSIQTTTYSHSLNISGSGNLTGSTTFVKQGLGTLTISNATLDHTGRTELWGGTVNFNGKLPNSAVWMNRFTTLNSSGGEFSQGLELCYGSKLNVGGASAQSLSTVTVGELKLNYGSRVVLDINSTLSSENDQLNMGTLTIGTKNWNYGPEYSQPVMFINARYELGDGMYPIGSIGNSPSNLSDILIESNGNVSSGSYLKVSDGILYLVVGSGEVKEQEGVDFAIVGMHPYTTHYYLPEVKATGKAGGEALPVSLSGTFTDTDGNVTPVGGTIYSQDYEGETGISGWNTPGAAISLASGDSNYGKYFFVDTNNTNTRYAYTRISDADVSAYSSYTIEFDLAIKNGDTDGMEFCVMSKGGNNPVNNWDSYAYINGNKNLLFDVSAAKNTTVFSVNGSTATTTLESGTWYHYTLTVDQDARTVGWSISNGSSGTFNLPEGTSSEFDGFYLVAGRYRSQLKLDNIQVRPATSDSFRFTRPGVLNVTAVASGYAPKSVVFDAIHPYAIYYESPAYNEISSDAVAATLGEQLWKDSSYGSRWAWWKSGSTYQITEAKNASGFVDNDSILSIAYSGTAQPLCLIEGYGIGQNVNPTNNRTTTVSATHLGDDNTIVYYKADNSRGNGSSYDEGYAYANNDGSFNYVMSNITFCKLIAYVPIHEEYDEASSSGPSGSGAGNIALVRKFSSISSGTGWNTLVVPFDMDDRQILTTFGPGTQVAHLTGSTPESLQFYADNRFIRANEPCLIRVGDVHSDNFYVIAGIEREVSASPKVETTYYDFVGSYVNSGTVTFPANTYFYNSANGDELSKVAEQNNITFKGFRGYFTAKDGSSLAKTVGITFGDAEDVTGIHSATAENAPQHIYSLSGQLIRMNSTSVDGLSKGIYIVGGKKVIVK